MSENKLEVYTLGKFLVKKNNNLINEKNLKSHKLWHLFKILISYPNKVFTVEELIDKLELSLELYDAYNSVQNLIFRLRKILAGGEKYETQKYIIYNEFGYSFNWKADYYFDFIEFEDYCQKSEKALRNNNYDDLLNYTLKAVKIYRGDFLDEERQLIWINQKRVYLQRLYLEEIYKMTDFLKKRGSFAEVEEICEQALNIEPFAEKIHYNLLNSLIKQNKNQKAKLHYQYMSNIYSLNKIKLNSNIHNLVEESDLSEQQQKEDIEIIKTKLNIFASEDKLSYVDKESFNYFCFFSIEKKKRDKNKIFLISISLSLNFNLLTDHEYHEIIKYLEIVFKNSIRIGDVICKWNKVQYLILFNEVKFFEIQKIMSRVRREFYQKNISQEIVINLDTIEL